MVSSVRCPGYKVNVNNIKPHMKKCMVFFFIFKIDLFFHQ